MKLSKKHKIWVKGEYDCMRNQYNPPVNERDRAVYHEAMDHHYVAMLYCFERDYNKLVDPGNRNPLRERVLNYTKGETFQD